MSFAIGLMMASGLTVLALELVNRREDNWREWETGEYDSVDDFIASFGGDLA
jgi:hypothetical protein